MNEIRNKTQEKQLEFAGNTSNKLSVLVELGRILLNVTFFVYSAVSLSSASLRLEKYIAQISVMSCCVNFPVDSVIIGQIISKSLYKGNLPVSEWIPFTFAMMRANVNFAIHLSAVVMCGAVLSWVKHVDIEPVCNDQCDASYKVECDQAWRFQHTHSTQLLINLFSHTINAVVAVYDIKGYLFMPKVALRFPKFNIKWQIKWPFVVFVLVSFVHLVCLFAMDIKVTNQDCIGNVSAITYLTESVLASLVVVVVGFLLFVLLIRDDDEDTTPGELMGFLTQRAGQINSHLELKHCYVVVLLLVTCSAILGIGYGFFASVDAMGHMSFDDSWHGVLPTMVLFEVVCMAIICALIMNPTDREDKFSQITIATDQVVQPETDNPMHLAGVEKGIGIDSNLIPEDNK